MKPGIHFHSDCPFFAGCENLLANLFQDDRFMESHGVSFSCGTLWFYGGYFPGNASICSISIMAGIQVPSLAPRRFWPPNFVEFDGLCTASTTLRFHTLQSRDGSIFHGTEWWPTLSRGS